MIYGLRSGYNCSLLPGVASLASVCISYNLLFLLSDLARHGLSLATQTYLALLLLADLGLLLSARVSSKCLSLPWLVLYLLHITIFTTDFIFLVTAEGLDEVSLTTVQAGNSSGYFEQFLEEMKTNPGRYFPQLPPKYLSFVYLGFAFFYAYTWVVVKSFHRTITENEREERTVELSDVLTTRGTGSGRAYQCQH